jgi:signal transduction histidine kinase
MPDRVAAWQRSTLRVVVIAEWIALVVGIGASVSQRDSLAAALIAAAAGGLWVLVATAAPLTVSSRPYVVEALALVGVLTTMTAVTLTGAGESPFVLLAATPAIHVTVVGSGRTGFATGLLSGVLVLVVAFAQEESLAQAAAPAAMIVVMAAVMVQIRRVLVDIERRASSLEETAGEQQERLAQLEETHDLLERLSRAAESSDFNLPAVGMAALTALERRFPGLYGTVSLLTPSGPVTVARTGQRDLELVPTAVPLTVGERTVGVLTLQTDHPLPSAAALQESLHPVALAMANALLLQDVAGKAVNEERARLARDLHDEIGPSLASLGLSLDVAILEASDELAQAAHLRQLRQNVGRLVDEVRRTVADLREPKTASLVQRLVELAGELTTPPDLTIDLDERRPARPVLSPQIHAIVCEAVRNASRHAGATRVSVHGWIDYDRGRVIVEDDGTGFSLDDVPEGHFGVMGMRERAALSGIALELHPGSSGTRIVVEWGLT